MFTLDYRPQTFKEFIGNVSIIRELLSRFPEWPKAFLITGPPGSGKTTLARLIAKQVKCNKLNIKEIDAGQDRGIDKIRSIIESAYIKPLVGNSKIYIFDEAQGLTAEAQQALLKITEEPPSNTYFILCSTNPQKINKALKTRCQSGSINLLPVSKKELGIILKNICDKEDIELEGLVKEIAIACINNADGIPRNVIMLFNKFYQYESMEDVTKELKNSIDNVSEELWDMVNTLDRGEFKKFLSMFDELQRGNFESFRITFGNIFKKKLLRAMMNEGNVKKYIEIIKIFEKPVDNNLGDIELIKRFGDYYELTM